ncbi:hypothetical protein MRY87_12670 [bacterium]|nr:hypothetical protein [bacterium]
MPDYGDITPAQVRDAFEHLQSLLRRGQEFCDHDGALTLPLSQDVRVVFYEKEGCITYLRMPNDAEQPTECFTLHDDGSYTSQVMGEEGERSTSRTPLPVQEIREIERPLHEAEEVRRLKGSVDNATFAEAMRTSFALTSIAGLPKKRVLATLLNMAAHLKEHERGEGRPSSLLSMKTRRDCFQRVFGLLDESDGSPMALDLNEDSVQFFAYNEVYGEGAGERAIALLRKAIEEEESLAESADEQALEAALQRILLTGGTVSREHHKFIVEREKERQLLQELVPPSDELREEIARELAERSVPLGRSVVSLGEEAYAVLLRTEEMISLQLTANGEIVALEDYTVTGQTEDGVPIAAEHISYDWSSGFFLICYDDASLPQISLRPQ